MMMAPCALLGISRNSGVRASRTTMTANPPVRPAAWVCAPTVSMTADREKEPVVV